MSFLLPRSNTNTTLTALLTPHTITYPLYHTSSRSVLSSLSDKHLSLLTPLITYWSLSLVFHTLDTLQLPYFEKRRIHESDEVKSKNKATMIQVFGAVLFQQVVQTLLGLLWFEGEEEIYKREVWGVDHLTEMRAVARWFGLIGEVVLGGKTMGKVAQLVGGQVTQWVYWWGIPIFQMIFAFFIIDTWQYFFHRLFHTVPFLYRHFHSVHHRLYVPYAFGALYNHPLEGLLFDSLGAVIAHSLSRMTLRQSVILFGISSLKTVDDHSGYKLWWDPCQAVFGNNAEYHDLHHQSWGIKKNFSQPFFTKWDDLLGTRMSLSQATKIYARKKSLKSLSSSSSAPKEATGLPGLIGLGAGVEEHERVGEVEEREPGIPKLFRFGSETGSERSGRSEDIDSGIEVDREVQKGSVGEMRKRGNVSVRE